MDDMAMSKCNLCHTVLLCVTLFALVGLRGINTVAATSLNNGSVLSLRERAGSPDEIHVRSQFWYEQSLMLNPSDDQAWLGLGRADLWWGNLDGAKDAFERSVMLVPQLDIAHFYLGELARLDGDMTGAASEWAKAGSTARLDTLYRDLLDQGRQDELLEALKAASRANPNSVTTYRLLGATLYEVEGDVEGGVDSALTGVLLKSGQLDRALEQTDHWIAYLGESPEAYVRRAEILAAKGEYDSAVRLYDQTVHMFPASALCRYRLGQTYQATEKPEWAVLSYGSAVVLFPQTNWYRVYLASALIQADDKARARQVLLDVLARDPEDQWALSLLEDATESE
jgi:tetratricopeptide (TPR) repeat protein